MSSAVIEYFAYYGYSEISPAVFENVMKERYYTQNSEKRDMFDLMRDSIRIDSGKFFATTLNSAFASGVTDSPDGWAITAADPQRISLIVKRLEAINRYIELSLANQNY